MSQVNPPTSVAVRLEAGTHWLCSCGRSQNFPYCDGGHQGSGLQPVALELDRPKIVEISQ